MMFSANGESKALFLKWMLEHFKRLSVLLQVQNSDILLIIQYYVVIL